MNNKLHDTFIHLVKSNNVLFTLIVHLICMSICAVVYCSGCGTYLSFLSGLVLYIGKTFRQLIIQK